MRRARTIIAALLGLAVGCSRSGPTPDAGAPGEVEREEPGMDGNRGEGAPPSGRLWVEARASLQPLDLSRLATAEGASGLLAAAGRHDDWGLTALQALPYAEDARIAVPFLCAAATRPPLGPQGALALRSLHAIAASPPRDVEAIAEEDPAACERRLSELAERPGIEASDRDYAASAGRLLREHRRPRE